MANGKSAENILGILGTALDIGGKLVLGPGANIDFGAPFKLGAQLSRDAREQQALIDVLGSNPATKPLLDAGLAVHKSGKGLLEHLGETGATTATGDSMSAGILPGESGGMPTGTGVPDFSSPEFVKRLADAGLTDLAEKIIFNQSQQKPAGALDQVLGMLQIQKTMKDLNEPDWMTKQQVMNEGAINKIQAAYSARAGMVSDKTIASMEDQRKIASLYQSALQTTEDPDFLKGMFKRSFGGLGPLVLDKTSPNYQKMTQTLEEANAIQTRALTGANLTANEVKIYKPLRPDPSALSPEMFRYKVQREVSKAHGTALSLAVSQWDKARRNPDTADQLGYDNNQLSFFKDARDKFNSNPDALRKELLEDPRKVSYMKNQLGFDPSIWFPSDEKTFNSIQ